ncbi:MAG TPA: hypothetical protein DEO85_14975 [Maritimibacter sp.]|nr:hypothetical protein [Maritimibacter sp.]
MSTFQIKPPSNAQRIWRVADLPRERGLRRYLITNPLGEASTVLLSKRRRQVMDLLMQGPVHCASPVRLSDMVHLLREETKVDIETEFYPGDEETGAGTYGVYFLRSKVTLLDENEVAA